MKIIITEQQLKKLLVLSEAGFEHPPVGKPKITSTWGARELDHGSRQHGGIDLEANEKTEVYAVEDGVVFATNKNPDMAGVGKYITIKHEDEEGPYFTRYLHLSNGYVNVNDPVEAGDAIGMAGKTGTKYHHLHFEKHRPNKKGGVTISKDDTGTDVNPTYDIPGATIQIMTKAIKSQVFKDPVSVAREVIFRFMERGEFPKVRDNENVNKVLLGDLFQPLKEKVLLDFLEMGVVIKYNGDYYIDDSKIKNLTFKEGSIVKWLTNKLNNQNKKVVKKYHTVKKGDTLYSISKKYKTKPDIIKKLTPLKSNNIQLGQKLRIS